MVAGLLQDAFRGLTTLKAGIAVMKRPSVRAAEITTPRSLAYQGEGVLVFES